MRLETYNALEVGEIKHLDNPVITASAYLFVGQLHNTINSSGVILNNCYGVPY